MLDTLCLANDVIGYLILRIRRGNGIMTFDTEPHSGSDLDPETHCGTFSSNSKTSVQKGRAAVLDSSLLSRIGTSSDKLD